MPSPGKVLKFYQDKTTKHETKNGALAGEQATWKKQIKEDLKKLQDIALKDKSGRSVDAEVFEEKKTRLKTNLRKSRLKFKKDKEKTDIKPYWKALGQVRAFVLEFELLSLESAEFATNSDLEEMEKKDTTAVDKEDEKDDKSIVPEGETTSSTIKDGPQVETTQTVPKTQPKTEPTRTTPTQSSSTNPGVALHGDLMQIGKKIMSLESELGKQTVGPLKTEFALLSMMVGKPQNYTECRTRVDNLIDTTNRMAKGKDEKKQTTTVSSTSSPKKEQTTTVSSTSPSKKKPLDRVTRTKELMVGVCSAPEFKTVATTSKKKEELVKLVDFLLNKLSDDEMSGDGAAAYLKTSTLKLLAPEQFEGQSETVKTILLEKDPIAKDPLEDIVEHVDELLKVTGDETVNARVIEKVEGTLKVLEKIAKNKKNRQTATDCTTKLLTHFKMAKRDTKSKYNPFSDKKNTKLTLGGGVQLELWNTINPETEKKQELGKGGLGYGRFGVLDLPKEGKTTVFVKKARFKADPSAAKGEGLRGIMEEVKQKEAAKFHKEVNIMKSLSECPHVVKVYDGMICKGSNKKDKSYFIMEMMPNGDLSKVADGKKALGLQAKRRVLRQALAGLAFAHSKGVLHRDLKPENIMLDKDMNAKLVDFGEACLVDEGGRFLENGSAPTGTAGYRPPEMEYGGNMDKKPPAFVFDRSTDLYAFMKTAEKILGTDKDDKLMQAFLKAIVAPGATADELLKHPALTEIDEEAAKSEFEKYGS